MRAPDSHDSPVAGHDVGLPRVWTRVDRRLLPAADARFVPGRRHPVGSRLVADRASTSAGGAVSGPARFLQEVVDALPTADPVGCIVAAIHRYDTQQTAQTEHLIAELAKARGLTIEQTRQALLGDQRATP